MTDDEMWQELEMSDAVPCTPEQAEEGEAYVRALEDRALEEFPELRTLMGGPDYGHAIEAAMDVLDGSVGEELKLELEWADL